METLLLQDWITLSTSVDLLTQSASSWLDVNAYEDIVLFLEVKEQSGFSPVISYQTAPVRENAAFVTLTRMAFSVGTTVTPILAAYASLPVSRFLRWQIASDGQCDATFRIWVAAYSLD